MATPEPYPYRKLNFPINNLEQNFTQEQKLQTRSNIGIPSSEDEEGKVLMVDNAAGELVWAEAPNGLPDIASGDEGKFLSVVNGDPAWADVDIPEQVNADWEATSGVQEIFNKPQMKPLVAGSNITITEGTSQFTISSTSDPQVNADWDATSGVSEILHKPNLSTVATTGQYADLLGKPDIPASTSELVNDSDFITASEAPVQDVKVDGSSVVDGNGVANISIPQFQQLNSDWDATSGVQEILNRPDVKPLVAGSNITITETPSSVEISGVSSAQQNADWDATSGVSEILHKPDLSIYAETANLATVATTGDFDDLVNKPTIPAAQVNSDWNASSGVTAILNKPTLSTVATTGDYNDLANRPSIPAAQVNADWNSSSGISEILNKPTLAAVATSGDYSDLSNTPIISNVPAVTSSDDDKVLKASYSGGVGTYSWETETGTTYSAGTGIDIDQNNAISVENPLPSSTSADEGKVLKVDANGDPTWATGGGGGGGVNADWAEDDPLEPSYIENKPAPKTLTAGTGISIVDGVSSVTISSNVTAPVQDVTVNGTSVLNNGVAAISVDQTYDASSANAQSGVAVAEGISTAIAAAVIPISVVSTLPASPDPNTLYVVTGA